VPVLKAADGRFYKLPNPLMFKEYVSDVEELLHAERHPLLTETSQRAAALTAFFAGEVSYDITPIDNPVS
jgi:D-alanine-D-alanine ligase